MLCKILNRYKIVIFSVDHHGLYHQLEDFQKFATNAICRIWLYCQEKNFADFFSYFKTLHYQKSKKVPLQETLAKVSRHKFHVMNMFKMSPTISGGEIYFKVNMSFLAY